MTLFWDPTGPLLKYDGEFLKIEDLNPEIHISWQMSRMELLRLGLQCIRASFQNRSDK